MFQQIAVIYFDTMEKANRFVNSTEGSLSMTPMAMAKTTSNTQPTPETPSCPS